MNLSRIYDVKDLNFQEKKDLTKFSTMRLKAIGNLVRVFSSEALKQLLVICNEEKVPYKILGWGANQLLEDYKEGLYIKLEFHFDKNYLDEVRKKYILPSSVSLNILTSHALRNGLLGWEVFTGIPASLGGAIYMNAGTGLGEIGDLVEEVKIMTKLGDIRKYIINEDSFSYRKNNFLKEGEILIEVTLKNKGTSKEIPKKIRDYLEYRNKTQPLKEFTCGCMFKNYADSSISCRAGQTLDIIGMKGFEMGGVRVSPLHANFIENKKNASLEDVRNLVDFIQNEFQLHFGFKLETEILFPDNRAK